MKTRIIQNEADADDAVDPATPGPEKTQPPQQSNRTGSPSQSRRAAQAPPRSTPGS